MKKAISVMVLSLLLVTMLCSCATKTAALSIENHTWTFTVMQNIGGEIITCSTDKQELNKNAFVADFTAVANDGDITVTDTLNNEEYCFTYTTEAENPDSTMYMIYDVDSTSPIGYATVGITEYNDGSSEYTLIVTIDGNTAYFVDNIE